MQGRVVAELSRRLVPAARRARSCAGARRSMASRSSRSTNAQLAAIRREIAGGNMDAVPLEKAPKIAVYTPPGSAALGRRRDARAQVRRHRVHADLRRRGRARRPDEVRLAAPASRGLHRAAQQVLPRLPRRAVVRRAVANEPGDGEAARLRERCPRSRRTSRRGSGSSSSAADSCSRCAARRRRSSSRSPARDVDIAGSVRRRDADGRERRREDGLEAGVRVPGRAPRAVAVRELDERHRRAPGQRRRAGASRSGTFTLFDFSAKFDPVASMLVQNHRTVIPDFYGVTTSFTKATLKPGVIGARVRGGRAVGEVHARRLRQGHVDVPRRPRSRGPAARDRQSRRRTCRCTRRRPGYG